MMTSERAKNLNNYTSFFNVSHPFDRFESAFKNKFFVTSDPCTKENNFCKRLQAFAIFSKEKNLDLKHVNSRADAFERDAFFKEFKAAQIFPKTHC